MGIIYIYRQERRAAAFPPLGIWKASKSLAYRFKERERESESVREREKETADKFIHEFLIYQ